MADLAKLTARLVYGDESEHERAAALLADCPHLVPVAVAAWEEAYGPAQLVLAEAEGAEA